jgi:hypothetical protein
MRSSCCPFAHRPLLTNVQTGSAPPPGRELVRVHGDGQLPGDDRRLRHADLSCPHAARSGDHDDQSDDPATHVSARGAFMSSDSSPAGFRSRSGIWRSRGALPPRPVHGTDPRREFPSCGERPTHFYPAGWAERRREVSGQNRAAIVAARARPGLPCGLGLPPNYHCTIYCECAHALVTLDNLTASSASITWSTSRRSDLHRRPAPDRGKPGAKGRRRPASLRPS